MSWLTKVSTNSGMYKDFMSGDVDVTERVYIRPHWVKDKRFIYYNRKRGEFIWGFVNQLLHKGIVTGAKVVYDAYLHYGDFLSVDPDLLALLISARSNGSELRTSYGTLKWDDYQEAFCDDLNRAVSIEKLVRGKLSIDGIEEVAVSLDYETYNTNKGNTMITSLKDNKPLENTDLLGGQYSLCIMEAHKGCDNEVFKVDIELGARLLIGDVVVAETRAGYKLYTVKTVLSNTLENAEYHSKAKAWVVDRVDRTQHLARVEATQRHKYILAQLEEKKKAMDSYQMFELLAKYDSDAAKMIEELKSLNMGGTPAGNTSMGGGNE